MKEKHGIEEIEQILKVAAKELPGVIKNLADILYSKEAGKNLGEAAGTFYSQLKEAGMDNQQAFELTRDYLGAIKNIGAMGKKGLNLNLKETEAE